MVRGPEQYGSVFTDCHQIESAKWFVEGFESTFEVRMRQLVEFLNLR